MHAITLLKSACEYDKEGRRLEALRLYEDGIAELFQVAKTESDEVKKNHYFQKLNEYLLRAEDIKGMLDLKPDTVQVVSQFHILEGTTGYSYDRLFGKHLDDSVVNILLEEPYLVEPYHFINLTKFMELVVTKCRNLRQITITTKPATKDKSSQSNNFATLVDDLKKRNIELQLKFEDVVHDRQIRLSNGYVIKIGRGLHIYKPTNGRYVLGLHDYSFRECRDTHVDIYKNSR